MPLPEAPPPSPAPSTTSVSAGNPAAQRAAERVWALITDDDECTEVLMNGPNTIRAKRQGLRVWEHEIRFGDRDTYHEWLNTELLALTDTADRIDGATNQIEGQLIVPSPDPTQPASTARVHLLAPPLVPHAYVTIAKRRRVSLTLQQMAEAGTCSPAMAAFLAAAAAGRLVMVISGLPSAGKTTLLEAMTGYWDLNDRAIVIEDVRELRVQRCADVLYLPAYTPKPGQDPARAISMESLVRETLRMRADRVLVGEIRGPEAAEFLAVASSGADGSATTIHAPTPARALDRLRNLASHSQNGASETALLRDIAHTIDLVIHVRILDARYVITDILEVSRQIATQGAIVRTSELFAFDPARGHQPVGRPSDEMIATLANRGVPLDPGWFRPSRP